MIMKIPIHLLALLHVVAMLALVSGPALSQGTVRHRVLAADSSKQRIAIFDEQGQIEWQHKIRQIHDLQLLDNGNVLLQTDFQNLVEVDRDHKIVWAYDAGKQNGNAGRRVEVHAFQRLPDGRTMIAESGPARILEVDRDGTVLHTVPLTVRNPNPHSDTRLVRKLQSGNYLVAHESDGAVREYDPSGKVVWDYDIPLFGKPRRPGHGPEAWGNQVFAAVRLPNGNTLIATGNGHSVLEVTPDKEVVWHLRQDDLPGIRLAWVTTLQVLPNGNYVIGNCHAGPGNAQIVEITRDKEVVWKFEDFSNLGNSLSNSILVDAVEDEQFYRTKVQPILAANCYECHGKRKGKVRGDLWLRSRTNVLAGGDNGAIVDLHRPETSRILRFLNHETPEHQMPPKPKKKLPAADIAILTEWVQRGVPMTVVEDEWIYERPSLFTDEALAHWSYQPVRAPEPPKTNDSDWPRDDLDRFILAKLEDAALAPNAAADRVSYIRRAKYTLLGLPPSRVEIDAFVADTKPGAHARLVDRLLASKQYGEHWGRHWLDLVRFGETNGYERDSGKPEVWRYRQYVIDAFNRNVPYDRFVTEQIAGDEIPDRTKASITATGYLRLGLWDDEPADRKQALFDDLDDIVRTTSDVFLGMSLGCARCHDHKLDPIPQADYYRFLGFFHNTRPYSRNRQHILTDVSTEEEREKVRLENETLFSKRLALNEEMTAIGKAFDAARTKAGKDKLSASDMRDLQFAYFRNSWEKLPDFDMIKPETTGAVPGDRFDIGLSTRGDNFGFVFEGKIFAPRDGEYTFILDSDDGSRLHVGGKPLITYDGIHGMGDKKRKAIRLTKGEHAIKLEFFQRSGGKDLFVAWQGPGFGRRMLSKGSKANETQQFEEALRREGGELIGQQRIDRYFAAKRELGTLKDKDGRSYVLSITEHGNKAPATHILTRGSAHAPAAEVQPGFPQILTQREPKILARKDSTGRRRALTEWLVAPDNPRTARVMVNRIWQFHFGRGFVRTPSDFGMHGRKPSHPLLLDYLAKEFVASGWDIKKLHRRILLSATFRMSSATNPRALAQDPINDLFWRVDVRRLSAEELRDSVLALSGQLDLQKFGGPSVYPEIPQAVLKGQSANKWRGNDSIENNSRRSVYTFVMRSLIDPLIESFDGPTTDTSCAERFQTTQPTQALTLLNSGFMHQAARRLATRLRREAEGDRRAQVVLAWQLATGRTPTNRLITQSLEFIEKFPNPRNEHQAMEQFSLIVLNLNEFLFVD